MSPLPLLSFLPWLALLAWLSSVAWFLTVNAFISFRYTHNLIEGFALVFNPGERVEGHTNFLWVPDLAALWAAFGLRPEYAAPWPSVANTIATLLLTLCQAARLPTLQSRPLVAWMTLGLLGSSATFAVWTSSGGLLTRQFSFFIIFTVVCLSLYQRSRKGHLTASLSLAACCIARFGLQRLAKNLSTPD